MAVRPESLRSSASDIRRDNWVDRWAPGPWRPYLRLARVDRPIGTWLLLFPCWWSIALAAAWQGDAPPWPLFLLVALGALVMRGAGCTVNDILDRDFDAKVARTATRPLPSGDVSLRQALLFLAALLTIGLVILLQLPPTAILLGVASLALVFPYPLMKRITYWPQLWLGLTFNWGALLGWAAVTDGLAWAPLLLYLGGIAWTLGYDTIYAHQDKEDDALVGVRSTALRLGAATRAWLIGFYGATLLLYAAAGAVAGLSPLYYVAVLACGLHFAWQIASLDIDDAQNCLARFRSNRWIGWLLLSGILLPPLVGA
jgi:4-hydroxybenzoate polyprenyltransferase